LKLKIIDFDSKCSDKKAKFGGRNPVLTKPKDKIKTASEDYLQYKLSYKQAKAMAVNKVLRRQKIRYKIRKRIIGTAKRPRLSVFRSNRYIYAQLVDDATGITLVAANSKEASIASQKLSKQEEAKLVGKLIAERGQAEDIESIVFDRSGYLYHGRVKNLADGAREGGLQF